MSPAKEATSRFGLRSFRAKFLLVVGSAVLFDLLVSGGLALWNVNRLSRDATEQVGLGLTKATSEYLQNYIATTAERTDLLIDQEIDLAIEVLERSLELFPGGDLVIERLEVGEQVAVEHDFGSRCGLDAAHG